MAEQQIKEMLDAGVHFGHLTRKWHPNMAPYIFMERNGIHIIDLYKTEAKLNQAKEALKKIAASGRKIMYVATKKQAKDIIIENAGGTNQPYITERWPGGMLTNFVTIRKAVKKMQSIDQMKEDGSFNSLSKRERLQINRQRAKLDRQLGSISDMTRLPGALFVVDITKEHIAVKEAQKLGIPVFAIVDTNSDPQQVDFAIPGNDDATKSINILVSSATEAIKEGLAERKAEKSKAADAKIKKAAKKKEDTTAEAKPAKQEKATADKKEEAKAEKKADDKSTKEVKAKKEAKTEKKKTAPKKEAKTEKKEVKAEKKEAKTEKKKEEK
jgi:small subunit ribosomal protein S2